MAAPTLAPDAIAPTGMPPLVRRLFVGIACSSLGSGMSMPYLFVYLTQVRHLPTIAIGLVLSGMGALGLAVSPLVGTLVDRFGPRPVLMIGLAGEAVAMGLVAAVHTLTGAILVGSLAAIFTTCTFPATTALLTRMVPAEGRERVYGLQFMLMNAGFGVGGLVASALVVLSRPVTFERLYLIDAVSYLGYIIVLATLPRGTGARPAGDGSDDGTPPPGWRSVLRDRTLLLVVGAGTLLLTCAYAQVDSGFTAYSVAHGKVPAQALGWAFAANTAVIVAGQLVTLKLVAGRRRSTVLGIAGLIWAAAWGVIAASGLAPGRWYAVLCAVAGLAVFGAAETIWAPVMPALINGLADERVRGRYNALGGVTWTVSGIIGPALAGLLVLPAAGAYWVILCIGGCLLGAVAFLALGRRLTPTQNGLNSD